MLIKGKEKMSNFKEQVWTKAEYKLRAEERTRCRSLCWQYNRIDPADMNARNKMIKQIIPKMGAGNKINQPFMCDYGTNIIMGSNNFFNNNVTILDVAEVKIGNNCQFAPNVIMASVYHPVNPEERKAGKYLAKKIVIKDNVWVCANAVIGAGVTIGSNSVVAAGAVVTKDVPAGVLVAGCPAVVKKKLK